MCVCMNVCVHARTLASINKIKYMRATSICINANCHCVLTHTDDADTFIQTIHYSARDAHKSMEWKLNTRPFFNGGKNSYRHHYLLLYIICCVITEGVLEFSPCANYRHRVKVNKNANANAIAIMRMQINTQIVKCAFKRIECCHIQCFVLKISNKIIQRESGR